MTAAVRLWRHPWQVVRLFRNDALIVRCSHRFELGAVTCSVWRDLTDRNPRVVEHDVRRTPDFEKETSCPTPNR